MRSRNWINLALATAALTAATIPFVVTGCSGDDETPGSDAGTDSSTKSDSSTTTDGATSDGATSTDGGTTDSGDGAVAAERARVTIVHAASGATPPVRICFATGQMADGSDQAMSPLPPLPYDDSDPSRLIGGASGFPGLPPGSGGALPKLPTDPATIAISAYVLDATNTTVKALKKSTFANDPKTCADLIGPKGQGGLLTLNTHYWRLPTIPKGALANEKSYLVALTGCPSTPGTPGVCGKAADGGTPTYPNFGAVLAELDRTAHTTGKLNAQVANMSTALEATIAPSSITAAGFTSLPGADAGTIPLGTSIQLGKVAGATAVGTATVADLTSKYAFFFQTSLGGGDGGAGPNTVALPLTTIEKLSTGKDPASPSTYFANDKNYTFIILGDPTAPPLVVDGGANPNYNGHGVHVIAVPNDPPFVDL